MFFLPILLGLILGLIVFMFTYIVSKRSGKYHLAPLVTFLATGLLLMYGLFIVGGFEGMAYGLVSLGTLITAIIGTLVLPSKLRKGTDKTDFTKKDKVSLVLLPLLLIVLIWLPIYADKNYWVIEEGARPFGESSAQGYQTSTISEGSKMLAIHLGEEYKGKSIEVKKVSQRGTTTVVLAIQEGEKEQEVPFIKIGLDTIKDPLIVKTTDGEVIDPLNKN